MCGVVNAVVYEEVYLDNNATTQPLREVRQAMLGALGPDFGNPSSAHSSGERARSRLHAAREALASLVHTSSERIVFTSGATESNNLVLTSTAQRSRSPVRIVTTSVEHSSILAVCDHLEAQGAQILRVSVGSSGTVSPNEVRAAITPETALVSVQWVNNETGVVQPIETISAICRDCGVLLHTDAAQAVGKLSIDLQIVPVDFLSLTGHKFHGPQGIGALYVRTPRLLQPMLRGGSQENSLRAGTENLPGAVGLGVAARLRQARLAETEYTLRGLRDAFEEIVLARVPDASVNGDIETRVCNTTNILFRNVDGQALVARLDQLGIRCSQGSACTSRRPEPSYVLRAMGLSEEEAYSSVRFSVSQLNTPEEVTWAAEQTASVALQIRDFTVRPAHGIGFGLR